MTAMHAVETAHGNNRPFNIQLFDVSKYSQNISAKLPAKLIFFGEPGRQRIARPGRAHQNFPHKRKTPAKRHHSPRGSFPLFACCGYSSGV
jgi:hypothetical protein